ncbi:MAG TPA: alpha/beta hydrolase, partial [Allocoleopsis sp.]
MPQFSAHPLQEQFVIISTGTVQLEGNLVIPGGASSIILFAHGSGSSRHSTRNRYVASVLQQEGLATLLLDLLTVEEEEIDLRTRQLRFNIGLLATRLVGATDWLLHSQLTPSLNMGSSLNVGYFGASTGSAAALIAATQRADVVKAIVSRGGRPDLAGAALAQVKAPTLLIVGGNDFPVIGINEDALALLPEATEKQLTIV